MTAWRLVLGACLGAALLGCATGGDPASPLATGDARHFRWTVTTSAPAARVVARWTDPASWSAWDDQIQRASIDGPFVVGARGTLVPRGGAATSFTVTALVAGERVTFATALPGGTLVVDRSIEPAHDGPTRFTHEVHFAGASGPLFAALLGDDYRAALPGVMERLARLAEADEATLPP